MRSYLLDCGSMDEKEHASYECPGERFCMIAKDGEM
jgi:hypothetical protein